MAFMSLVISQLLETRRHRAKTDADNPSLRWVLVGSLLVQATSVGSPAVRALLGNAPLTLADLAVSLGSALLVSRGAGSGKALLAPREEILRGPGLAA
jgi:hypothetical protein